ncbi:MAG: class I adenylate-forming enzyme family protein [Pseudolysinimonas sp.]
MRDFDPIAGLLERLSRQPDADAVIGADATLTVTEFWDSALRFAQLLREEEVGPGVAVGVTVPALLQPVFAVALWIVGAIGAVAPQASGDELASVLDRLVTAVARPGFPPERQTIVDAAWLGRAGALPAPEFTPVARARDEIVRLVFSSGTTGAPKAIPFTVDEIRERVERGRDFWMHPRPFLSILGLGTVSGSATFFSDLDEGSPYLVPGTADENLRLLAATGAGSIHASPVQLSELLTTARHGRESLPGLQFIQSAGSPLPDELARTLGDYFDAQVEIIYGSTEVGGITIRRGPALVPGDVGEIQPFATVEVLDDAGRPRLDGAEGLIRIRRPHQAHQAFRAPAHDEVFRDGWFVPGDIGRVVDGRLVLRGRRDDLINAAGIKVDPERIERRALRHPGVIDAVAVGVEDARGVAAVALAVVADRSVELSALREALRADLGDAAPRVLERIDVVPRTENGKVRRAEVAANLRARLGRGWEL